MRTVDRELKPVPIFVISFNRGEYLNRTIKSYRAQNIPVEIIIHDNGSDEPATLELLREFSSAGVKIYRYEPIHQPDDLNNVELSVRRHARETGHGGPYVVTDCDIDLSIARADALRVYIEVLDMFKDVECVGPMLRITDIPKSYPLFNRVMARHISQFWGREPEWANLSVGNVAYLKHRIDTTFAVHRPGSVFRRLKAGIRLYHPFEARHLDWYASHPGSTNYSRTSSPAISHWSNEAGFAEYASFPDCPLNYTVVEGEIGALRTVMRSTSDNPA
ncbi:MAG: glycosyltransferase family A protein [Sphingomonas sp.]